MSNKEFERLLRSIKNNDDSSSHCSSKTNSIQKLNSIYLPPKPHKILCPTQKMIQKVQKIYDNDLPKSNLPHNASKIQINHMFNGEGRKQSLDQLLKGNNANIWKTALSNELDRLTQGVRDIKGNDVVDFLPYQSVPPGQIVTYSNMVCDIHPLKSEKYRVLLQSWLIIPLFPVGILLG